LETALRAVVQEYEPEIRLTPSQNLVLAGFDRGAVEAVTATLDRHGIAVDRQATAIRRAAMACPALPTCGLALAESERYLPDLMSRLEDVLAELELGDLEIVTRITGCPNGCARPYMAELGLVGKGPGKYQIYLGGNASSTRLNRLYRDSVKDPEIVGEIRSVLQRFAREKEAGERFGDWCARVLWPEQQAGPA
jgi:sulfite reductase (NADPH) hemoprotein beta-component